MNNFIDKLGKGQWKIIDKLGITQAVNANDEEAVKAALAQSQDYVLICELANGKNMPFGYGWLHGIAKAEKKKRRRQAHEENARRKAGSP